jgi:hypothetical protein
MFRFEHQCSAHLSPATPAVQVAASKASTIIVLHPEDASSTNAEAIKVSVAMSLTALGATGQQRVVVQGVPHPPHPQHASSVACRGVYTVVHSPAWHPAPQAAAMDMLACSVHTVVLVCIELNHAAHSISLELRVCVLARCVCVVPGGTCRSICGHQHHPVLTGGHHTTGWWALHHPGL